jgi:gamma-glutamyl-gamma-aminobutyrate hydrolase
MPLLTRRLPIALPHALAEPELLTTLAAKLDGIYLPGSPSNVQPHLMVKTAMSLTPIPGVIF